MYVQLDTNERTKVQFDEKFNNFHLRNYNGKCYP